MASLGKPIRCITEGCIGLDFIKESKPERWICATCKGVVAERPKRESGICRVCGISRKQVEFVTRKNICKLCFSEEQRQYREDNQDKLKAYRYNYFKNLDQEVRWQRVKSSIERSPESFLADQLYHIRSRSSRPDHPPNPSDSAKREVDLDRSYLLDLWNQQSGKCALTGLPMVHQFGSPRSASIDRIDSSKGHIKGNVQIICLAINRMKHTLTNEQVLSFLREVSDSLRGAV